MGVCTLIQEFKVCFLVLGTFQGGLNKYTQKVVGYVLNPIQTPNQDACGFSCSFFRWLRHFDQPLRKQRFAKANVVTFKTWFHE